MDAMDIVTEYCWMLPRVPGRLCDTWSSRSGPASAHGPGAIPDDLACNGRRGGNDGYDCGHTDTDGRLHRNRRHRAVHSVVLCQYSRRTARARTRCDEPRLMNSMSGRKLSPTPQRDAQRVWIKSTTNATYRKSRRKQVTERKAG